MEPDEYRQLPALRVRGYMYQGRQQLEDHLKKALPFTMPSEISELLQHAVDEVRVKPVYVESEAFRTDPQGIFAELEHWSTLVASKYPDVCSDAISAFILEKVTEVVRSTPKPLRKKLYSGFFANLPYILLVKRTPWNYRRVGHIEIETDEIEKAPQQVAYGPAPVLALDYGLSVSILSDRCTTLIAHADEVQQVRSPTLAKYLYEMDPSEARLEAYRRVKRNPHFVQLVDQMDALLTGVSGVASLDNLFTPGKNKYLLPDNVPNLVGNIIAEASTMQERALVRCCTTLEAVMKHTSPANTDAATVVELLQIQWEQLPKSVCLNDIMMGQSAVQGFPHSTLIKTGLLEGKDGIEGLDPKEAAFLHTMVRAEQNLCDLVCEPLAKMLQSWKADGDLDGLALGYITYLRHKDANPFCLERLEELPSSVMVPYLQALDANAKFGTHDMGWYENNLKARVLKADDKIGMLTREFNGLELGQEII